MPFLTLLVLGLGWGLTVPLGKIAVSQGYRATGVVFWQFALGALALALINARRGKPLPWDRRAVGFYLVIALVGTALPNTASYTAAVHLPGGIMAIVIAMAPLLAFPVALWWGQDRFSALRLLGLCMGLAAMVLIAALIAPAFYAIEGCYVAARMPAHLDAVQVLLGASILGMGITLPLVLVTGTWISPLPPWGVPDLAILLSGVLYSLVYAGYVWLVGHAGAVFAAQSSYLVTGFGVLWSGWLLNESYSAGVWAAFALMMAGLFLVQPRRKLGLAVLPASGQ